MISLPFSNKLGESYSPQASKETMINMFSEVDPGRSQIIRRQRPGLTLEQAQSGSNTRGIEFLAGKYYLLIDNTFYSWDETTLTTLGTINTFTGPVTMATNNAATPQIALCDGEDLWVWDGSTLTKVTENDFKPAAITSLGGYGIMEDALTSGRFYTTALNDFTDIDALDFANAETKPDDTVRLFVDRGECWMFGSETTEIFRLSGLSFPLVKVTGSEMERGCKAKFSVAADDNSLFWLGDDGIIYRADGYSPTRVSVHAVERKIANLSQTVQASAEAFFMQVDGNKFYTLRFPGHLTLQYNIATQLWNECNTYGYNDWQITGSAGQDTRYVLTTAGICSLDTSVNQDNGTTMRRVCVSPPLYNEGNRFQVFSYYLDCEVGRTDPNNEPEVMLEVSRDGEGWGNVLTRSMGAVGQYKRRVIWRNLGIAREMQFRIACSDDVPFKVMTAGGNIVGSNG